ncbi:MAG: translation elongation factor Ts [Clostridia bacterium]|nr:translation elongation factor Ts [Clostridia bacterium]
MAAITAKDVAALRAKTGVGMMECKKALVEAEGDMEKALKVLRERGLAVAAKKESRIAAEGVVDILKEGNATAMIEVNSETDFVAKNASFKDFVKGLLRTIIAVRPADVDALMACAFDGSDVTVDAKLSEMRFTIGEKISIRRFELREGYTGTYVHHDSSTAVVVVLDTTAEAAADAEFAVLAKNIALQIAGNTPAPSYVTRDQVPAAVLEEEKNIQVAALKNDPKNANKPTNILEKIVLGRMGKFYENVCLVDQAYILDDELTVQKYIDSVAKKIGAPVTVKGFLLYNKGEGLEKREDNFADEIAKLTQK